MFKLRPVDKVEVLILVDNYVDLLLPGNEQVQRPAMAKNGLISTETLIAEHGLSLLVTVYLNGESHSVLLDTGYNNLTVQHNARILDRNLAHIDTIVLSHGHMDHTGGLESLLKDLPNIARVVVHPAAFCKRHLNLANGDRVTFPPMPDKVEFKRRGVELVESVQPLALANETMLVTGQVPRITSFENGFPGAVLEVDEKLVPDSIDDDQALIASLGEEKGAVVISACAHSGIINTMLYALELTGQSHVHAVIGGFHLTGSVMEPVIAPTLEEMRKLSPEVIVPMHCTGSAAVQRFGREFPEAFVLSSVGTSIVLSK